MGACSSKPAEEYRDPCVAPTKFVPIFRPPPSLPAVYEGRRIEEQEDLSGNRKIIENALGRLSPEKANVPYMEFKRAQAESPENPYLLKRPPGSRRGSLTPEPSLIGVRKSLPEPNIPLFVDPSRAPHATDEYNGLSPLEHASPPSPMAGPAAAEGDDRSNHSVASPPPPPSPRTLGVPLSLSILLCERTASGSLMPADCVESALGPDGLASPLPKERRKNTTEEREDDDDSRGARRREGVQVKERVRVIERATKRERERLMKEEEERKLSYASSDNSNSSSRSMSRKKKTLEERKRERQRRDVVIVSDVKQDVEEERGVKEEEEATEDSLVIVLERENQRAAIQEEEFEECLLTSTCFQPCIRVVGVSGENAKEINGTFFPSTEIICGRPSFFHIDDKNLVICFDESKWEIKERSSSNNSNNDVKIAYAIGKDQTSPFTVSEWKVNESEVWVESKLECLTFFPSLLISGCVGYNEFINGVYHYTTEIVGGKPMYINSSNRERERGSESEREAGVEEDVRRGVVGGRGDVCICFNDQTETWQIQPKEEKGTMTSYAFESGNENTSSFSSSSSLPLSCNNSSSNSKNKSSSSNSSSSSSSSSAIRNMWNIYDGEKFIKAESISCVCVFPSVCVSGVKGELNFLNGVYFQTGEMIGGRPSFQKNDREVWICYIKECHNWMVQLTSQKGTRAGYMHAKFSTDQTSPFTVKCWKLFSNGDDEEFVTNRDILFTHSSPSLTFHGATESLHSLNNEIFHQTACVIGGRCAYKNQKGNIWVCYSPLFRNWKIQSQEAKGLASCYAFSVGCDQTSPFTVSAWRVWEEQKSHFIDASSLSCNMSFPSLNIYGATGVSAHNINGVYFYTHEIICGKPAWKKMTTTTSGKGKHTWICFDGSLWQIQREDDRCTPIGYAYAMGVDQTSPFVVSGWKLFTGEGKFQESGVKCITASPSILFSGASGQFCSRINGTFHQTARVVCGRPAYKNQDGSLWCCFVANGTRWSIQRAGDAGCPGGYAYSIGDDQTSPLTASGWKVGNDSNDEKAYVESDVKCACTFPSLSLFGAVGAWANYVNGTFHSTAEIVCGRPTYRNEDVWICYVDDICSWQVQSTEFKGTRTCYAHSVGTDATSPFTVTGWKTCEQGKFIDSPLSCVIVFPSISISGATGPNASHVNGMFHQTSQACCGRPSFRKADGTAWLCYLESISSWQVQPFQDEVIGYAYSVGSDQTSPLTVTEWKIYNPDQTTFQKSDMVAAYAFPSLSLSGATGHSAAFINGTFHQTGEMIGGRPSFRSIDGTLVICFDTRYNNWQLLFASNKGTGKCHAFSVGPDQTSPHTVSGWKILKRKHR